MQMEDKVAADDQIVTTLIRGGWLAAWDGEKHVIVRGGEVVVRGGKILYVGTEYRDSADRVIEEPGWFVCPGFINLHAHTGVELMAPFVDIPRSGRYVPSLDFVSTAPRRLVQCLDETNQRLSAEFSLVQMLKTGTTTVVDVGGSGPLWWLANAPTDAEALVDIAGRVGSRLYVGTAFRSSRTYGNLDGSIGWHPTEEMGRKGLEDAVEFAQTINGAYGDRIRAMLTPHAAEKTTPELLGRTATEARRLDVPIQIHAAQGLGEVRLIRERHGCSVVEYLHDAGLLGPRVTLGHCIYISGHPKVGGDSMRDLAILAETGTSVAHSPLPFARGGNALHTLPRYLEHGVNVGIGCDIWPADIIAEMRLAWFIGKLANNTAEKPSAMDVFHASTVGSADALGRTDLGRLEVGARADIVCIDLSKYHYGPVIDPVRSLISCGAGGDVALSMVDGETVVLGGKVVGCDEEKLRQAAGPIYRELASAASERDPGERLVGQMLGPNASLP